MPAIRNSSFALSLAVICSFCGTSRATLVALPGTILATDQNTGLLWQFDAQSGTQVGSLQLRREGANATASFAVGTLNGVLYASAAGPSLITAVGTVNTASGDLSTFGVNGGGNLDELNGQLVISSGFTSYGLYDSMMNPQGGGFLGVLPGTYTNETFPGFAATSTNFITSYFDYQNEIQFWNAADGRYVRRLVFNNPVSTFHPCALEYDEVANDFWFAETTGLQSRIKRFENGNPDAVWTINVPGYIRDLAYIPIPAPGFAGLFTAASVAAAARRRRERQSHANQ